MMKKNEILIRFGISILVLITVFSLGELYIRLSKPYWTIGKTLKFAPTIFSRHRFKTGEQTALRLNPKRRFKINKHGYRGDNFKFQKQSGDTRILIFGGSQVFDPLADKGNDWPHQVEERLNEIHRKNGSYEVINAGVPGHASFDSFGHFYSEGYMFEPDYVVLCNAWLDIRTFIEKRSLYQFSEKFSFSTNYRRTYFNSLDRFLGEHSQLYTRIRINAFNLWNNWNRSEETSNKKNNVEKLRGRQLRQYKLTLRMFTKLARTVGAEPILMTQPRLVSAENSEEEKKKFNPEKIGLNHSRLVRAFNETSRIIKEVSSSEQTRIFDASKQMTGNNKYFADHVHLTKKGRKKLVREFIGFFLNEKYRLKSD